MSAPPMQSGGRLDLARGDTVICVGPVSPGCPWTDTLRSVLDLTPGHVPVLVQGAPGDGPSGLEADRFAGRVTYLGGADGTWVDRALAATAPADVVLVAPGCLLAAGWLDRLTDTVHSDAVIATASALTLEDLDGAARDRLSVPFETAAERVAAASPRLRPRLEGPQGPCIYVRRSAIDLIGSPAAAGFARGALARGLAHVLADDVLVRCTAAGAGTGGASDTGQARGPSAGAEDALRRRALGAARRAIRPLRVAIDARILAGPLDGTRRHVLELISAVARTEALEVVALVPASLDTATRSRLERLPAVTLVTPAEVSGARRDLPADVVHRPHQVSAPADLTMLGGLGERLVVTHQDLISFHNPAYFRSPGAWQGYRRLTRRALATADHVVFFSEYVRRDALAHELVEPHRSSVVHIGVDHVAVDAARPARPAGVAGLREGEELIVCLGTDYGHKNRVFALRLVAELQRRHGWSGRLVLAGPHVAEGSSRGEEAELLASDPALARAVTRLETVSEAEREWLLRRAALVVYPTVTEGFGLIPYEAAAQGVPCLWANGTALSELLPEDAAGIVGWDVAAAAGRAISLMHDPAARTANVRAVTEAGTALRWEVTGRHLVEVYRAVCDRAPSPASVLERSDGLMRHGLSEDATRLVGPDGVLTPDLERPLLAVLTRPRLARALGLALKTGYRISQPRRR